MEIKIFNEDVKCELKDVYLALKDNDKCLAQAISTHGDNYIDYVLISLEPRNIEVLKSIKNFI